MGNSGHWLMPVAALAGLLLLISYHILLPRSEADRGDAAGRAAMYMEEAITEITAFSAANEINIDRLTDPQMTGLIGPEISPITTTLGQLEAKRSTLNPLFASLLVRLLVEAGVENGDTIAAGCSGSFPGLLLAVLAASKAMDICPVIIVSVGSSSFGASNPDFTILDIYSLLLDSGLFEHAPAAVSLGGDLDTGNGFEGNIAAELTQKIHAGGYPLISEPDLRSNVRARDEIYDPGGRTRIKAFINCGGNWANMGTDPLILSLNPGIVNPTALPPENSRGMIFNMLGKDVPVIHLLNIKGLALRYDLPWDPVSYDNRLELKTTTRGMRVLLIGLSLSATILFIMFLVFYPRLNNINR